MKTLFLLLFSILLAVPAFSQQFETAKQEPSEYKQLKVKVGADFALQLQLLNHNSPSGTLIDLKNNFNLPTANINITASLAPGIQLYINNYMSSRHHNEAWVEGGYLLIDHLPFFPSSNEIMKYLTIKIGVMMPNYGDAHFFRSNNASVLSNPFVGNWIMDAYTTNPGIEILYRNTNFFALIGTNNGRVNYGRGNDIGEDLVFNWKAGYDTQITDQVRLRLSLSGYHVGDGHSGSYLWDGDRAGARYYNVMQDIDADSDNFRSGRWSPGSGQTQMNSYIANIFAKVSNFEIFGIYESMKGVKKDNDQHFTQTAFQAIYRINNFYIGTRLNKVSNNNGSTVTRTNLGGGWYMLDNIIIKADYVIQKYKGEAHNDIAGGKFNGLVIETAISF